MKISRDHPCLYLTSVTNKRLPVFQTDKLKAILTSAFDEARRSAGFKIFAYVIMPDHYHILTDGERKPSEVLRYLNGISAKRIIDFLKEKGFESSLRKIRMRTKKRGYKHSFWEHHPNAFLVTSEKTFMQKVNYIHKNPVRAGMVEHPDEYLYSSARIWNRRPLTEKPLKMDVAEIDWRVS